MTSIITFPKLWSWLSFLRFFILVSAKETPAQKMKVLMLGWEFPPHISGGLGTACHGLTKALSRDGTQILFVVPRAHGDEEVELINASDIIIAESDKSVVANIPSNQLKQTGFEVIGIPSDLRPYASLGEGDRAYAIEEWSYEIASSTGYGNPEKRKATSYHFSGSYGTHLLEEVSRFGEVAGALAKDRSFDVIHAHDWLTYPAGITAKEVSGKPLVVHVHATEFDRSAKINNHVYGIECEGLAKADHVVAVSNWTKRILTSRYRIAETKISVVHNGIVARNPIVFSKTPRLSRQVITFLGRVTYQKGPQYFIEAARRVLQRLPNAHFVVAGSGDLLPAMIERVAQLRLSSHFHFTGFLKGDQVDQVWSVSDLYVMPSVSEPFGITPLEAIQSGVPVIISNQSGVAEVMPHAIAVDFWNVAQLANAMLSVLLHKSLAKTLKKKSKKALKKITWDVAATKINSLYHEICN
jgi:glycogen synthase